MFVVRNFCLPGCVTFSPIFPQKLKLGVQGTSIQILEDTNINFLNRPTKSCESNVCALVKRGHEYLN